MVFWLSHIHSRNNSRVMVGRPFSIIKIALHSEYDSFYNSQIVQQDSSEEIVIPCEDLINRELENTDIRNAKHEVKKTSTQRIYIHQITNVSRIITIFAPK